jgi:hypothetical protein
MRKKAPPKRGIAERVRAGLARARSEGKRLRRPSPRARLGRGFFKSLPLPLGERIFLGGVPNIDAENEVDLGFHGQVRLDLSWPGDIYSPRLLRPAWGKPDEISEKEAHRRQAPNLAHLDHQEARAIPRDR